MQWRVRVKVLWYPRGEVGEVVHLGCVGDLPVTNQSNINQRNQSQCRKIEAMAAEAHRGPHALHGPGRTLSNSSPWLNPKVYLRFCVSQPQRATPKTLPKPCLFLGMSCGGFPALLAFGASQLCLQGPLSHPFLFIVPDRGSGNPTPLGGMGLGSCASAAGASTCRPAAATLPTRSGPRTSETKCYRRNDSIMLSTRVHLVSPEGGPIWL